jgi:hypothetical protein
MLMVESALKGYSVEARDGSIGKIDDCLFDDRSWKLRWLVVGTGAWLTGRKVLIHPSAVGRPDMDALRLPVHLTKAQIKGSPDISSDLPVSQQMENDINGYYGWDPGWGGGGYFGGFPAPLYHEAEVLDRPASEYKTGLGGGDPSLRSMAAVNGYHVKATDGAIGHIENFIIDDATWDIRYLIVDTRNWWFGQHVLMSPFAVKHIDWNERNILLNVALDRVKKSPPWKPLDLIERSYQQRLHGNYGWPGYGW